MPQQMMNHYVELPIDLVSVKYMFVVSLLSWDSVTFEQLYSDQVISEMVNNVDCIYMVAQHFD